MYDSQFRQWATESLTRLGRNTAGNLAFALPLGPTPAWLVSHLTYGGRVNGVSFWYSSTKRAILLSTGELILFDTAEEFKQAVNALRHGKRAWRTRQMTPAQS